MKQQLFSDQFELPMGWCTAQGKCCCFVQKWSSPSDDDDDDNDDEDDEGNDDDNEEEEEEFGQLIKEEITYTSLVPRLIS